MKERQPVPFVSEAVLAKRIVYNKEMVGLLVTKRAALMLQVKQLDAQLATIRQNTMELQGEMRRRRS